MGFKIYDSYDSIESYKSSRDLPSVLTSKPLFGLMNITARLTMGPGRSFLANRPGVAASGVGWAWRGHRKTPRKMQENHGFNMKNTEIHYKPRFSWIRHDKTMVFLGVFPRVKK